MSELNYEHVFDVLVDKTAEYVPQITICSTCIRNRVKLGIYIQPFVRDTVEAFIDQYRLYV